LEKIFFLFEHSWFFLVVVRQKAYGDPPPNFQHQLTELQERLNQLSQQVNRGAVSSRQAAAEAARVRFERQKVSDKGTGARSPLFRFFFLFFFF